MRKSDFLMRQTAQDSYRILWIYPLKLQVKSDFKLTIQLTDNAGQVILINSKQT